MYQQNDSNSCFLSTLASDFFESVENVAARVIALQIEKFLNFHSKSYLDRIKCANVIVLEN